MRDDLARKKFTALKERAGQRLVTGPRRVLIPDADLDEFWATLEPATIDFMIGECVASSTPDASDSPRPAQSIYYQIAKSKSTPLAETHMTFIAKCDTVPVTAARRYPRKGSP